MFSILRVAPFIAALLLPASPRSQDMPVRVEAIRLLEHANALSMVSGNPYFRMDVNFHAYNLDGLRSDGTFHRILSPDGQWIETIYPPIHSVAVFTKAEVLQTEYVPPPPEIRQAFSLLPVRMLSFDDSDTILSIFDSTVLGRPARCIRFETTNGKTVQQNEVCIDTEIGTLLRRHIGNEVIEDSDYFQIGSLWYPHQIRQYLDGKLRMEEEQTGALLESPIDLMTFAPPNPQIIRHCKQFRRAIGSSMPQPAHAGPGPWFDVQVHIVVGRDGRVHETSVLPLGHPTQEAEAARLAQSWQFDPATCDGRITIDSFDITIHFPPQ